MKRYFYHGTSADNLQSILKNGITEGDSKLWNCSESAVYLWDSIRLAKANDRDLEEDADCIEQEAFTMANESAQIACSRAKDCRLLVLKILIDDSEVQEDYSCENMEGSGAVVLYRDVLPSEIVEIKVSNDLSLLRGYFINLIIDRNYNNIEFNQIETSVASAFKKAEFYPEDLEYIIEWDIIHSNEEITV